MRCVRARTKHWCLLPGIIICGRRERRNREKMKCNSWIGGQQAMSQSRVTKGRVINGPSIAIRGTLTARRSAQNGIGCRDDVSPIYSHVSSRITPPWAHRLEIATPTRQTNCLTGNQAKFTTFSPGFQKQAHQRRDGAALDPRAGRIEGFLRCSAIQLP